MLSFSSPSSIYCIISRTLTLCWCTTLMCHWMMRTSYHCQLCHWWESTRSGRRRNSLRSSGLCVSTLFKLQLTMHTKIILFIFAWKNNFSFLYPRLWFSKLRNPSEFFIHFLSHDVTEENAEAALISSLPEIH